MSAVVIEWRRLETSSSRESIVDVLVASCSSNAVVVGGLEVAMEERRRSLFVAWSCAFCRSSDCNSDFCRKRLC